MVTLSELNVYPIKSCRGISLKTSELVSTGLQYDRQWMVIDEDGAFLTQRELPRLALVSTAFKLGYLVITAPGMLRMDIPLDVIEDAPETWRTVRVWRAEVQAVDEGDVCAQWFTDFLGRPCRLVKFHPDASRVCNPDWTGDIEATTTFTDGYPMLLISQATLDDINARLRKDGEQSIPMNRFRPNLVVTGLEAYEEDFIDELTLGDVKVKIVKPCTRCQITNTNQDTADVGVQPLETLATYRGNPKMDGAVTVGQNVIVLAGVGGELKVGATGESTTRFAD